MGFDVGKLKDVLLAQGLPVVEDDLQKLTGLIFDWIKSEVAAQPWPISVLAPVVDTLKGLAIQAEDGIDGKLGQ